ncbi:hypothetical protein ASF58_24445 [Methylobacterium sp. Leaf125]|uniref:caspase family protein n=1 Tax=Methylobacterium sp. Leaf125 TaxID=1736265 RepID=UPI0006F63080|nr:caspase family protein [Methylobacterium sp. Leaf125]KQQ30771.1 hypothetical protein ASF58_24445 [Methylobacterium sp. Leaf125]
MRYISCLFRVFAIALLLATNAIAQEAQYMKERPTKRIALVVGNSIYASAEPIESAKVDAERMTKLLRSLNFEVIEAMNVEDVDTFYVRYFDRFLSKIGPGDFAVLYFSGHGMSYGGENYLATTGFPPTVPEGEISDHFLSVQGLRRLTTARNPGFVLMLLDACRNIGALIKKPDSDTPVLVPKGLGHERIDDTNVVLGFATQEGGISFGSSEPGAMSTYTEAVVETAPVEDRELSDFFMRVRFLVLNKTKDTSNQQTPWRTDSNSSYIYFMPSKRILALELEAWKAALRSKVPVDVEAFLSFYSTSRYADAARLWLKEHGTKERPSTKVLPTALERAWTGRGSQATPVTRFDGPFSLPRRSTVTTEVTAAALAATAAATVPGSDAGISQVVQAKIGADVLLSAGSTTLTAALSAREFPSASAREVATVPSGTTVKVEEVVTLGPCPSSDDLGHSAVFRSGGSGPSGVRG